MQVSIYTVARDAEDDVDEWCRTTADADRRLVVDCGSTDATALRLRVAGVETHRATIQPWRSDDALNSALAMMHPTTDVCIRLDMNERLRPGWRQAIERVWSRSTSMLLYPYNWGWINYVGDRIHRRSYRWRGRAHERLIWCGQEEPFAQFCPHIIIDYQPRDKPKPFDLPLLEMDAKEWPNDQDIALCYARELVYQERYEDGRRELLRYLSLAGEIGARPAYAFRLLAYVDRENAMAYFNKAESAHSCPSNYLAMADYYFRTKQWRLCYTSIQYAFTLERNNPDRLPGDWGDDPRLRTSLPHEFASMAAFHLWDFESSYGHAVEAVRRAPNDLRLRNHLAQVQAKITAGSTVGSRIPSTIIVPMRLSSEEAAES